MRAATERKYRQIAADRLAIPDAPDDPDSEDVRGNWSPLPGPQAHALDCPADELFYGGAAGGGKSNLLVGLALNRHHRSLILRREATQLLEIKSQLLDFAPVGSHWRGIGNGGLLRTPDGREIELAGLPNEDDKRKYQGRPHDLKAFDEVTEFTEGQVDFVCGWNRTTRRSQRCRKVFTGNPPLHSGGEWVIRRFSRWIDPTAGKLAAPGSILWFVRLEDKEEEVADATPVKFRGKFITPQSRTFIPATLEDNPILAATDYGSRIMALPPAMRDALMGDFLVSLRDDPWQVIPTAWIRAAQQRWKDRGWKDKPPETPLTMSGLDVAYGGSDRTVLARRYGDWIAPLNTWAGEVTQDGAKTRDLVKPLVGFSAAPINVDVIGYGAAAYEQIRDADLKAVPVNFGGGASHWTDARRVLAFANVRAASYWQFRDALDPDLDSTLCLPDDPDLLAELATAKYELRSGRIFICPKDEIMAELGRSPDKADAVVLAVHQPPRSGFRMEVVTVAR